MQGRIASKLTYANVTATIALFLALGAGAYAAFHLPKNSVKSKNIANGQVKARDLAKPQPVRSAKLATQAVAGDCSGTPSQWTAYAPSAYGQVGYWRDLDGIVHLQGSASWCNAPSGTIFTLPRGYRPGVKVDGELGSHAGGVIGVAISRDSGTVQVGTNGFNTSEGVGLNGISFRCGPSGKHGCP